MATSVPWRTRSPRARAALLTIAYLGLCLVLASAQQIITRLGNVESSADSAVSDAAEVKEMAEQTASDLSDVSDTVDDLQSQVEDLQSRVE